MTAISRQTFTGGITHVEARQMVMESGRNKDTLAAKIQKAMPELSPEQAKQIATQIHATWEKANSGVTSDKQYQDNFAKLTGGDGVIDWDPGTLKFTDPSPAAKGATVPLASPAPAPKAPAHVSELTTNIHYALGTGDTQEAKRLYLQASPAEKAQIVDDLLADPATAAEGAKLLALDPDLQKVLEATTDNGQLRRLLAGVAGVAAPGKPSQAAITKAETALVKERVGAFFAAHPEKVDQVFKGGTPSALTKTQSRDIARLALEGFAKTAKPNTDNFSRLTVLLEHAIEQGDAASERKYLARSLHHAFYGDSILNFMDEEDRAPMLKAESDPFVKDIQSDLKKRWKEIPGADGEKVDVSHAIVGVDMYLSTGSTLAAWTFTDGGDYGSQAATGVGTVLDWVNIDNSLKDAGNLNWPDIRGNDMGERIYDRISDGNISPLSRLFKEEAP